MCGVSVAALAATPIHPESVPMATRGGDGKSVGPSKALTTSSWLKDVGITEPVHQHDIYMASWMASLYR